MRKTPLRAGSRSRLSGAANSGAPAAAAGRADEFLAMQSSAAGAFNYARLSAIQAFLDASPTRCSVFLISGEEIRAFQTCASIIAHIDQHVLVTLPGDFGSVLVAPDFVTSLGHDRQGGCRLNLLNGAWVPVKQSCSAAIQAISRQ